MLFNFGIISGKLKTFGNCDFFLTFSAQNFRLQNVAGQLNSWYLLLHVSFVKRVALAELSVERLAKSVFPRLMKDFKRRKAEKLIGLLRAYLRIQMIAKQARFIFIKQ